MVNEPSMSRIYQFIIDRNKSFGIVSANRVTNTDEENRALTDKLKSLIRKMGYGFVPLEGDHN